MISWFRHVEQFVFDEENGFFVYFSSDQSEPPFCSGHVTSSDFTVARKLTNELLVWCFDSANHHAPPPLILSPSLLPACRLRQTSQTVCLHFIVTDKLIFKKVYINTHLNTSKLLHIEFLHYSHIFQNAVSLLKNLKDHQIFYLANTIRCHRRR